MASILKVDKLDPQSGTALEIGTSGDTITVPSGAVTSLDGAVTVNDSSNDVDFRVESNGNANMLFVDGGNDRVGIGTNEPASLLHLDQADGTSQITVDSGGSDATKIMFQRDGIDEFSVGQDGAGNIALKSEANWPINFLDSSDNVVMTVAGASGAITKPLQPCFSAQVGTQQDDFAVNTWTGNTMEFDTEIFDLGANYDTSTYTFTAPVTGKYIFNSILSYNNLDADATYWQSQLKTSNREYAVLDSGNQYDADPSFLSYPWCIIADMDASDTAYMRFYQQSGTAQADLRVDSRFTGALLC